MCITAFAEAADFQVIVNRANPMNSISKAEVSKIFLKKTTTWPNGQEVMALDLTPESPVREKFSQQIHDRSVASIQSYWQRQIFSGKGVPPVQFSSENDVVVVVADSPAAIGYVAGSVEVGNRAKVLEIRD
jgi:ABC-type phosphate transport system substrate-binding protein